MREIFTCDNPEVCIKRLLFREQQDLLEESRITRYEMGLHDGGSSYVLAQLKAEERTIMRVERNVLRIALSGGKCNGDGGCGAVFKL